MKVLLADALGMCFGVRDALRRTAGVEHPSETTIYGELVHNPVVLKHLTERGFQQMSEEDRGEAPPTPAVLVTAHGISDRTRASLLAANRTLIDTTCPLVRRVHEAAQRLAREGFHVLLLGKPGHVEVQGVVEDLASCDVVAGVEQVRTYPHARLGVVCQTTLPPQAADALVAAIRRRNPQAEIRFVDTICDPTRRRQQAIVALMERVQAVVVVGGENSNNTRQLVELCRQHQKPVLHVETAAELDFAWLAQFETVGLTAGTSTLDSTIGEVFKALRHGAPAKGRGA